MDTRDDPRAQQSQDHDRPLRAPVAGVRQRAAPGDGSDVLGCECIDTCGCVSGSQTHDTGRGERGRPLDMNEPTILLEWQFSPPDYFAEPITISQSDYTMVIENGKVEARIDLVVYDANPSMRAVLHEGLNDRFFVVQLLSHRPYELSKPSVTRVHPDGRRDVSVEAEIGVLRASVGPVDIQVLDKDGNVVGDSRRDRIEKRKRFTELVMKHGPENALLDALLKSYDAAVHDPDNELVHLYEIRDALSTEFDNDEAARSALGISSSEWKGFGRLCNFEPLRQGRHRGENIGALRDATEAELIEARGIARAMVEAYVQHLEKSSGTGQRTPNGH
jgi:hypothetical protein